MKEYTSKTSFENIPYYQGKMDLWYSFACIGIDLSKQNGLLSFIATNNWVTNSGASIMRNKIIDETQIIKLIDFGSYMIFENASIQTMIMMFKKASLKSYKFDLSRIVSKKSEFIDVLNLLSKNKTTQNEFIIPEIDYELNIGKPFTFSNSEREQILNKISKIGTLKLLENEVANGIHPHYDYVSKKTQLVLGNDFKAGQGIFVISNNEKESLLLNDLENTIVKPYYTTEQMQKWYATNENKEWIIYTDSKFKKAENINPYPNIKKHLDQFQTIITSDNKPYGLHRAREERFFKDEKIITLRKCVGEPKFTYTNFDCYVSATFYVIKTERINHKFLTGLLNSKLIAFWLRNKGKMQGNNFQLDKEPLLNIPVFIPKENDIQLVSNIVDDILKLKSENSKSDISHLESKINEIIYRIYDLTNEEIAVIENN